MLVHDQSAHHQQLLMKGLQISGATRSPPSRYMKPAFRVVLRMRLKGSTFEVEVIVLMAVRAHRMFSTVNRWLYVQGLISSNFASVNFSGMAVYRLHRGACTSVLRQDLASFQVLQSWLLARSCFCLQIHGPTCSSDSVAHSTNDLKLYWFWATTAGSLTVTTTLSGFFSVTWTVAGLTTTTFCTSWLWLFPMIQLILILQDLLFFILAYSNVHQVIVLLVKMARQSKQLFLSSIVV